METSVNVGKTVKTVTLTDVGNMTEDEARSLAFTAARETVHSTFGSVVRFAEFHPVYGDTVQAAIVTMYTD